MATSAGRDNQLRWFLAHSSACPCRAGVTSAEPGDGRAAAPRSGAALDVIAGRFGITCLVSGVSGPPGRRHRPLQ